MSGRSQRQTLFFTATWPREVRKLASEFLSNPAIVYIGNTDTLVANKDVTQIVKVIDDMRGEKDSLVQEIIRNEGHGSRIIIFCSTKRMCDQLERSMSRMIPCSAIHGDKDQTERNRTLNEFKVMFSCLHCLGALAFVERRTPRVPSLPGLGSSPRRPEPWELFAGSVF